MMPKFIKSSEKKAIIAELNEKFGIMEIPYLLVDWGKERIKAFSGSLSKEEISDIAQLANIEGVGIYLIRREKDGLRLSFEGVMLLKEQIKKSILEISDEEAISWMHGNDLQKEVHSGIYVLKHNDDFLGCGKSNGKSIFNYVPKERRLKN